MPLLFIDAHHFIQQPEFVSALSRHCSEGCQVLRKTRSAVAYTWIQEPRANPAVRSNSLNHLMYVRAHGLADRSDGVDERNLHRQKRIGSMLDQFGAFGTRDNQWRWNACPVWFGNRIRPLIVAAIAERRIDFAEQGSAAFAVRSNYNPIGIQKIRDRAAFSQELRIRSDIEGIRRRGVAQDDLANPVTCVDRNCALLNDNLIAVDCPRNAASHGFHVRQISFTLLRGRRAHRTEYCLAGPHRLLQVAGNFQPTPAMTPEQFRQKVFMHRNLASFQGSKLLLIVVNQNDFMSQIGKARPGHEPNVSRSHNRNMHLLLRISSENKFDN